jgi:choline dehydrogenase
MMEVHEAYDYIVVGAGAAGCVVAHRLSEDPDVSVLLVDAGGPEPDPPMDEALAVGSPIDWKYVTDPEPGLHNRSVTWPRGKVYGGSSTISSMQYLRGHRFDYDHWNYLGNAGWSYADVLPYFKKAETNADFRDDFHGTTGPLSVESVSDRSTLKEGFLSAAERSGFRAESRHDFNGSVQEDTAGYYQKTFRTGRRQSVAAAYLAPALRRPNLTTRPFSFVTKLTREGARVAGIEYTVDGARSRSVRALREVIVSAGAVDSPKLLLLSGIGPADHLREHGIAVRADLPGVGHNLQDHVNVTLMFKPRDGIRNLQNRVGSAGLFFRTRAGQTCAPPDIQLFMVEVILPVPVFGQPPGPMYFCTPCLVRPQSTGTVTLRSADPSAAPVIRANYFQRSADIGALVQGVQMVRELTHDESLSRWLGAELLPGANSRTADEIGETIRQMASTNFHPAGTCKMGHDAMAVVDDQLRVYGIEGLRVVDASIMPTVVNANTIAPCVMIGEKAADLIRGRELMPADPRAESLRHPQGGARSLLVRLRERHRIAE